MARTWDISKTEATSRVSHSVTTFVGNHGQLRWPHLPRFRLIKMTNEETENGKYRRSHAKDSMHTIQMQEAKTSAIDGGQPLGIQMSADPTPCPPKALFQPVKTILQKTGNIKIENVKSESESESMGTDTLTTRSQETRLQRAARISVEEAILLVSWYGLPLSRDIQRAGDGCLKTYTHECVM